MSAQRCYPQHRLQQAHISFRNPKHISIGGAYHHAASLALRELQVELLESSFKTSLCWAVDVFSFGQSFPLFLHSHIAGCRYITFPPRARIKAAPAALTLRSKSGPVVRFLGVADFGRGRKFGLRLSQ